LQELGKTYSADCKLADTKTHTTGNTDIFSCRLHYSPPSW